MKQEIWDLFTPGYRKERPTGHDEADGGGDGKTGWVSKGTLSPKKNLV